MESLKTFLGAAGLAVATTLGAGIFVLPYIFEKSGWLVGVFYLVFLGLFITLVHYLYFKALEKNNGKNGLLGLVKIYLGENYSILAWLAIILGLILVLTAYLILAGRFLELIIGFDTITAIIVFWILASLPLIVKLPRLIWLEFMGAILMALIVLLIIGSAGAVSRTYPVFNFRNLFFPFGPVLFSLAGWTAIEPIFEWLKNKRVVSIAKIIFSGTFFVILVYLMFVLGILASAPKITADTISGLAGWPFWKIEIIGWLGLFAVWTSYLPIALEIKNSLERDLFWRADASLALILFLPAALLFSGFNNFLNIIGLVGGIFLSFQYIFIISVIKKILDLKFSSKLLLDFLILIFFLAALYELYHFVIT